MHCYAVFFYIYTQTYQLTNIKEEQWQNCHIHPFNTEGVTADQPPPPIPIPLVRIKPALPTGLEIENSLLH